MKIIIINQHTANFGDDAAGVSMACQIRQQFPQAELNFVYSWPWESQCLSIPFDDDQTFHHTNLVIQKTNLFDAVKYIFTKFVPFFKSYCGVVTEYRNLIISSDFVIVSPGGANIGIYQDWISLFRILVAVLENKQPIFYLNSIGKSGNLVFDLIARYVLKKSQVFVREKKSYQELKQWEICSFRGVDAALSQEKSINNSLNQEHFNSQTIIFIPTRLGNWHPCYKKIDIHSKLDQIIIPSLVKFSQENNLKIKILPHLYGCLSEQDFLIKTYNGFRKLGLTENQITLLENVTTFKDYQAYIAQASLVVSMRYHGIILAIKQGIPFISLAYENKMKEACNYSGMSEFNFDLTWDYMNQTNLKKACEDAYKNRQEILTNLRSKHSILSELSRLPIFYLYFKSLDLAATN